MLSVISLFVEISTVEPIFASAARHAADTEWREYESF